MVYRKFFGVPSWRIQSPFNEIERIKQQMDHLLEDFSTRGYQRTAAGVYPPVNVGEDKENYYLYAELPGVKKEALVIEATGNTLSVSGEREIRTEEGAKYHRKEREGGRFSRILTMPGDIQAEKVSARLQHGMLSVTIPKAEAEKPKKISIQ